MRSIVAVLLLLFATSSHAAPNVVVQGIQMPAWLQRGEIKQPLSIGSALKDGDRLITGANARILLQAADGSAIKLGENASLTLSKLMQQPEKNGLFSAFLDVAKGAFRFTTGSLAKFRSRKVNVRIAGATVGIRGTDVWGKAGAQMSISAIEKAMGKSLGVADKNSKMEFDTVCLIEGKISVAHGKEAPFVMDKPQSFYVMPKGAAPLPVAGLSSEQLAEWATQTEITAGQGAIHSGGKWKVSLLTTKSKRDAMSALDELRTAGYDARIRSLQGGQYQLRITHLPSREEAQALAQKLTGKLGITTPTIQG